MRADFTQSTMVKTLGRKQTRSGTVMFKRPDKMRWDYAAPVKQQLITDGYSLWVYQPEEKVVFLRRLDDVNSAKVPMKILAGEIDINSQFVVKLIGEKDGITSLELRPKKSTAGYEKAILHVSADRFEITRIDIVDLYGNATDLKLTNVKYNNGFKDSEFVYSPIPGVKVESAPVIE